MSEFYSITNGHITISLKDVIEIIKDNSRYDRLTVKKDLLDNLQLEDTKENRRLLLKVTDELKKRGTIFTCYGLNEDEPGYRGRGYVFTDPPVGWLNKDRTL